MLRHQPREEAARHYIMVLTPCIDPHSPTLVTLPATDNRFGRDAFSSWRGVHTYGSVFSSVLRQCLG